MSVCPAQATRTERNVLRDSQGHLHLGKSKSVKKLFSKNGVGAERYAKSEYMSFYGCTHNHPTYSLPPSYHLIKCVVVVSLPPRVLHFVYNSRGMNVVECV